MSVEAISWALNEAPVDNPTSKLVLIALANHARPDGSSAFPSVQRMMRYTCLSERSVRQHLGLLEEAGIIERCDQRIVAAYIDRADRRPTGYNLCINSGSGVHDMQVVSERGASHAANGVQDVPERGAGRAPKPLNNRTSKPSTSDVESKQAAADLAKEFVDSLMSTAPRGSRPPKVTAAWVNTFDRMLRLDKRTPDQIRQIMRLAHHHTFWKKNILSPDSLRRHFERLLREQADPANIDVDALYNIIHRAIRDHGHIHRPEFDDPDVEAIVRNIGWKNLCMMDEHSAKRVVSAEARRFATAAS